MTLNLAARLFNLVHGLRMWPLTFIVRGHETLQPLGPVTVLFTLGGALLIHVSCYVRGQKLRLQLTQGNVDQAKFGACAVRQTAGAFLTATAIIIRFSVQTLRKRQVGSERHQPEDTWQWAGGGYLVIGVGGATVQLLLHSVQPLQEGRLWSSEELRSAGGGHHLFPQRSWRSLINRTEVKGHEVNQTHGLLSWHVREGGAYMSHGWRNPDISTNRTHDELV